VSTQPELLDVADLQQRVQDVYRQVAQKPHRSYHFEMGRALAARLGYPTKLLDEIPAEALDSFAGVGYFLDLAAPRPGERVLDLGSGSGTDSFGAAALVGSTGQVTGIDMTDAQLDKADRLRAAAGLDHVGFLGAYIEQLPIPDDSYELVISNGVINLSADKSAVFAEAPAHSHPAGGSPSPTSSPNAHSPNPSPATPNFGPPASAALPRSTTTSAESRTPDCASTPSATTPPTRSYPAPLAEPPRPTASRASRYWPASRRHRQGRRRPVPRR
jgi:2-polyprenyl-3-methyl-5-hydroxy-6-metoxy-1,4-benzoquinol methylase